MTEATNLPEAIPELGEPGPSDLANRTDRAVDVVGDVLGEHAMGVPTVRAGLGVAVVVSLDVADSTVPRAAVDLDDHAHVDVGEVDAAVCELPAGEGVLANRFGLAGAKEPFEQHGLGR